MTDANRPDAEAQVVAGGETNLGPQSNSTGRSTSGFPDKEGYIDITITQVNYSTQRVGQNKERPVVHVFGRRADNTPEHIKVLGLEPYFYVPEHEARQSNVDEKWNVTETRKTDDEGNPFESMRGDNVRRVVTEIPRNVGNLRDEFDTTYEADIRFPNRFLIDTGVKSSMRVPERREDNGSIAVPVSEVQPLQEEVPGDMRVNMFDIEVDDRNGFPEDGEEEIICLTSWDSYFDEYVVWVYEPPNKDVEIPTELDGYDEINEDTDLTYEIVSFDDERAMLDAFVAYLEETDADVTAGWNFEDFDAPYLVDRIDLLDDNAGDDDITIDSDRLSRIGEIWGGGWGAPNIKGRVVFDLLEAYKRTQFSELESYRLEAVGQAELGAGKEYYDGKIGDLWENDMERLLEYSLRDVELMVELDRKQDIMSFWDEVRKFVGCKLEDAPIPSDVVDMYILHKVHGRFVLPSKGEAESEDYEGGAVFEPIEGVRDWVTVLDLKSLYPMCMITVNASPETKVDPEEFEGETYRAPNGTHFRKDEQGIIKEVLDELLEERENKKELRNKEKSGTESYNKYDQQQAAIKVIMNSCFTPDTEVMTPNGVKQITDMEVGDEVYSYNTETDTVEIKPVVETQQFPDYDNDLIDIETSTVDFTVTPDHNMLARRNDWTEEDEYSFIEAGDMVDSATYELPHDWDTSPNPGLGTVDLTQWLQEGEVAITPRGDVEWLRLKNRDETTAYPPSQSVIGDAGHVTVSLSTFRKNEHEFKKRGEQVYVHDSTNHRWIPATQNPDDWLQFLGWFVTEGSTDPRNNRIHIGQRTDEHRGEIKSLLDRMELVYGTQENGFTVHSKSLMQVLERLCGSDSHSKHLPEFVWSACTTEQMHTLFETMVKGDGDSRDMSPRYSTVSERLRDDFMKLCVNLGLNPRYSKDSGVFRVLFSESKNTVRMQRSGERREDAGDGVYCVTVADNHSLLAGRNGKFQFVGQCYGVLGWEKFRLYDKEMGAAVTAVGREVIKFTEQVSNELGYSVTYGDTDSVMLQLSDTSEKEDAMEKSFEIEETINERYDDLARERFNADSHRFLIEFEKLYRRFFQAGKKKRYAGHIVWKEGQDMDKVDITGFECERSDMANITQKVQKEVIKRIVHGQDEDEIRDYMHNIISDFRNGEVSLSQIGIPSGIGQGLGEYENPTAHIRGTLYANLFLGTNLGQGDKPKRVYLRKVHPDFFNEHPEDEVCETQHDQTHYQNFKVDQDVIAYIDPSQVPEDFKVDWDKMLNKTLEKPVGRVLSAMDIPWDDVKSGQTQVGLGGYM